MSDTLETRTTRLDAAPDHDAQDIKDVVAVAQAEMERLIQLAGLQNDPLRHSIQALSVHLKVLARISQTVAVEFRDLPQAMREPWTGDERKRVIRDVVKDTNAEVSYLVWERDRRRTIIAGFIGVIVLMAGIAGGYILGQRGRADAIDAAEQRTLRIEGELSSAVNGLSAGQAKVWALLMRGNQDILAAIPPAPSACFHDQQQAGRQFCWARLWIEPAQPPTPTDPPAAPAPMTTTGKKSG